MNGKYSMFYTAMGGRYLIPINTALEIGTGQGWHSDGPGRGSMSLVAHIAGRLLLGQKNNEQWNFQKVFLSKNLYTTKLYASSY